MLVLRSFTLAPLALRPFAAAFSGLSASARPSRADDAAPRRPPARPRAADVASTGVALSSATRGADVAYRKAAVSKRERSSSLTFLPRDLQLRRIADRGASATVSDIGRLFTIMANSRDSPAIQAEACRAIRMVAKGGAPARQVLVQEGGVEKILAAMSRHADSAPVQAAACDAFVSIAFKSPAGLDAVATPQCVKAVVEAMQRHSDNSTVQVNACDALRSMSFKDRNLNATFSPIMRTLSHFQSDERVVGHALSALAATVVRDVRSEVFDEKALATINAAIVTHSESESAQQAGCKLVWRLFMGSDDEFKGFVGKSPLMERVLFALRRFPATASIQVLALEALRSYIIRTKILDGRVAAAACAQLGIMPLVLKAMDLHLSSANVQLCGCDLVYMIICDRELRHDVMNAGAADRVLAAMDACPESRSVQRIGAKCIEAMIFRNDGYRDLLVKLGAAPRLERAIARHAADDADVARDLAGVLAKLSKNTRTDARASVRRSSRGSSASSRSRRPREVPQP